MTTVLLLLIALSIVAGLVTLLRAQLSTDGYGTRPQPRSRLDEAEPRSQVLRRLTR